MPDHSPEELSNEIQRLLQQAVLDNYPNPERRGCPGDGVLQEVARRQVPIHDQDWEHITHCSPCFRQFLDLRQEMTVVRSRLVRRNRFVLGGVFAVIAAAGVLLLTKPSQHPEANVVAEAHTDVDMRPFSVTRSGSDQKTPAKEFAGVLDRKRNQLNVILPVGADEGNYEVRLMDDDLHRIVTSGTTTASFRDHLVRLQVDFDLTNVQPGRYVLASRREGGGGWMTAPVLVR